MTDLCSFTESNFNAWDTKRFAIKKLDFSSGIFALILFQTNLLLPDGFLKFSREVICDVMASHNKYLPPSFNLSRVSHMR